jgi:phosphatidylserine/phosphatidylglycerophosphate/cardiolipin synthase-like enzyme
MTPFHTLSRASLEILAAALEDGRAQPPYSRIGLSKVLPGQDLGCAVDDLGRLSGLGMQASHIAFWLRAMADERGRETGPVAELVWSGPESTNSESRDTGVVLQELFRSAENTVLVAGFAIYDGRSIFKMLADRMDANPHLIARFFLNVARQGHDTTAEADLVVRFAHEFREKHWPGKRLPDIYYDPRSLAMESWKRSSLHAKCAVIDSRRALVTSANFTPAAQDRNIEAGVVIDSVAFATRLQGQFESLVTRGLLRPLPL